MKDLQGKVAFVSGGSSGIGLGIVLACLKEGMQVIATGLSAARLAQAAASVAAQGCAASAAFVQTDVTDRSAMLEMAAQVRRRFGRLHLLVNNAGVCPTGPLRHAGFDDWDFGLGVNIGGVVNGLQCFLPLMREHGEGGHVVNTASLSALVWMPSAFTIYTAGKAAVIAISECIRDDLVSDGIGVSVLCPGPVKSNIHKTQERRPEGLRGASGFLDRERNLAERQQSPLWMEPSYLGERVIEAIKCNEFYIITHGEWRNAFEARVSAIRNAMPQQTDMRILQSLS